MNDVTGCTACETSDARKHGNHNPIFITAILPVRDEASSLRELHANLGTVLRELPGRAEIIYVDDGSSDGSFDIVVDLAEHDHRVRGVQLRQHYGKSAALAAGFERARGEIVVTLDADLQDDPTEIPHLLAALDDGYDLVCGWRQERADVWHKRLASWFFNRVTTLLVNLPLHDLNSGLKVFGRAVAKEVRLYGELHRFLPVLAARQGFRVGEVPVVHHPRKYGHSKYGPSRAWAGALDLLAVTFLTRYNTRPLQFFGVPGLLCFLAGIGISTWLAWGWLFLDRNLSNRPLLFLGILLIIVGIQFLSLGLLGEMITAAHADRLHYSVRQETG